MPRTRPENCCSRIISVMRRLSMNLTPLSRALNSRHRVSAAPFQTAPGAAILLASAMMRGAKWLELFPSIPASCFVTVPALMSVLSPSIRNEIARRGRDAPLFECVPVDAREANVIVHQELPGPVAVVSPGTMHLAVIVAIRGMAAHVEDRPVGDVPEQKIGILLQLLRLVQGGDLDETLLV